jgi:hypothetical protein
MRTQKIKIILLVSISLFGTLCAAVILPLSARGSYQQKPDYRHFTHKTHSGAVKLPGSQETRELKCDSCHERQVAGAPATGLVATTERNKRLQVNFPGHKACVECHITQFTLRPLQLCAICHNQEQGLTARPPQRDFPTRHAYNAYFDGKQHADHVNKYALPTGKKLDCSYCHQPTAKQAALTIASHPECYVCHTPGSGDAKASLKAGCGVCHTNMAESVEPFFKKYTSRAYGASFTHRTHVAYAGGKCDACHTLEAKYNQPLPAPSKIRVKEHLSPGERSGRGCFSCHDGGTHYGRAVFRSEDPGACIKCHKTQDKNGRPLVLAKEG